MSYPAQTYPYAAYQHPQSSNTPQYAPQYSYQTPTTPYPSAQGYPPWPYGYSYPQPQQNVPQPQRPVQSYSTTNFTPYPTTFAREPSSSKQSRKQSNFKGLFAKELPKLMYGFGDDKQVANDTVSVMEEMLIEYIVDVCHTAVTPTRKARLQIEDLRRALSRPADAKKLARMEELLFMQEDIKRARKEFEENEVNPAGVQY